MIRLQVVFCLVLAGWTAAASAPALAQAVLRGGVQLSAPQALPAATPPRTVAPAPSTAYRVPRPQGVVGLDLLIRPHTLQFPIVHWVFPDSPAARAGLHVGDYILSVDGVSLTGHSIAQVDAAISDEPGRQVTFRVRRQGTVMEKTLTVAEGPLASGIWPGPVWRQATP